MNIYIDGGVQSRIRTLLEHQLASLHLMPWGMSEPSWGGGFLCLDKNFAPLSSMLLLLLLLMAIDDDPARDLLTDLCSSKSAPLPFFASRANMRHAKSPLPPLLAEERHN